MGKKVPPIWVVITALGAFSVLTVAVLSCFGLIGIEHQLEARKDVVALEKILINHNNADNFMDDVRADVLRAVQSSSGTNREGADAIRADVRHHSDVVMTAIGDNLSAVPTADLRGKYSEITGLAQAFIPAGRQAVELALTDPVAGAANYEQFRQTFTAMEESMDNLRDILQTKLHQVRKDAAIVAARVEQMIVLYSAIGAVLLILMTAVAVRIANSTARALANSREEAQRLALHDTLTGLPNRAYLSDHMSLSLKSVQGTTDLLSVICLDLDRFKQVNDTLGHPIGDALLCQVADRLRGCLRASDVVARLGGDEFAIVQAPITRVEDAGVLAQNVIDALSKPFVVQGHQVTIGTSVGIALAPVDTDDAGELLKMADIALYRAKTDGRGLFRVFERGMDTRLQARRELELDLREAVVLEQFEVHYQPLVDVSTGHVTALEALVRWKHPERGLVGPDEFIPLAEETGLIAPLGAWVLQKACLAAAAWPENVKVAVNVSAAQFKNSSIVSAVLSALNASGLNPERLELEITETALLTETNATLAILHELRSLGVRIAMDDFGTGYSSLGYLRSFPFDKIKIDRCFIQEITTSADCKAIVRAVTGLGVSLGIATTAEGVETTDQLDMIRAEGCNQVQGYYFSRPVPADAVMALLGRSIAGSRSAELQGVAA